MSDAHEIHVLNHRVRLLQPAQGFRTSLDSVMLAAACPAKAGDHILDLGCGVGAAGLCVLWRVPQTNLKGIDIQETHIDLARQNADLNTMAARAQFAVQDVRDLAVHQNNHKPVFDQVICNPPYLEAGTYTASPKAERAIALGHNPSPAALRAAPSPKGRGRDPCEAWEGEGLRSWIDGAFYQLKNGGYLTLIHRADYLDQIIFTLGACFGGLEIIPLWPRAGEPAKRLIIRARKNSKSPAVFHPGIVLHEDDGAYTKEADAVLREGVSL